MLPSKNILICPLDWGFGHTTRCIPIIKYLLEEKHTVYIACNLSQKKMLEEELLNVSYFDFDGYEIQYSETVNFVLQMAKQVPKMIKKIKQEHFLVDKLIEKYKIDLLISDNRYGCSSRKIPCVFITHQTNIKSGIFSKLINKINHHYIAKFNQCWVPDDEKQNLSGDLSNSIKINNVQRIGVLSRFKKTDTTSITKKYDVLFLLSGIEPQRTLFENKIIEELKSKSINYFLVRGVSNSEVALNTISSDNYANYLSSNELQKKIDGSDLVICRSGYSTVMDLYSLQKKVFFVPTPGQTEQEYLAKYLLEKNIATFSKQSNFNLNDAIAISKNYKGFTEVNKFTAKQQKEKIRELIASLF